VPSEQALAQVGAALAEALLTAVPGWVERCVAGVLEAWTAAGGDVGGHAGDRAAVLRHAHDAGQAARAAIADDLALLLSSDVDAQWTTPLSMVRGLVRFPTAVLRQAGVAPLERDRFHEERFPDDPYGLVPGSLGVLGAEVSDLAMAWGAAKAAAHRARHGPAGPCR
jgi:hypothetical protein